MEKNPICCTTSYFYLEYAELRDHDIITTTCPSLPQAVFHVWESLVDHVNRNPEPKDFNWHWILPQEYARSCLMYYVWYRSELIHPARLSDWLLSDPVVDSLPNQGVIHLLEKCQSTIQRADANKDGYIEYSEFLRFVSSGHRQLQRCYLLF